jgi:hypothetical protein
MDVLVVVAEDDGHDLPDVAVLVEVDADHDRGLISNPQPLLKGGDLVCPAGGPGGPPSPTQIAKALEISRASVYRHLATATPDQP